MKNMSIFIDTPRKLPLASLNPCELYDRSLISIYDVVVGGCTGSLRGNEARVLAAAMGVIMLSTVNVPPPENDGADVVVGAGTDASDAVLLDAVGVSMFLNAGRGTDLGGVDNSMSPG